MAFELPALPIYMIWHETRRNDAAHLWLREVIVAELGRSQELRLSTSNGYVSSNGDSRSPLALKPGPWLGRKAHASLDLVNRA